MTDLIEVRFDRLEQTELERSLSVIFPDANTAPQKLIATFRPSSEGGFRDISLSERRAFWRSAIEKPFWAIDLEEDLLKDLSATGHPLLIASYHDTSGAASDIKQVYDRLLRLDTDVFKIAVRANSILDTIPIWSLLRTAKLDRKQLVPIAMGEPGKWTRILGPANGAFMAYAPLEEGEETAPGQITASDLVETYRVRELDPGTEVFGIIAGDTRYSMSPYIQNAAFRAAGMNRVFIPLEVERLGEFFRRMVRPETREVEIDFRGFSVTNPHKQAVIEHLDEVDKTARAIGAVNTVKVADGRLTGTNTDAEGFIVPLNWRFGTLQGVRVAVAGAGGAARACIYALRKEGAEVTLLARDPASADTIAREFGCVAIPFGADLENIRPEICVNATPLGTKGEHENETPVAGEQLAGVKLVYDLTYNPRDTRLLREARAAGCETIDGLEMLIGQGARQFEIWTGEHPDIGAMREAAIKKLTG